MRLCFGGLNAASRRVGCPLPPIPLPLPLILAILTRHTPLFPPIPDPLCALGTQDPLCVIYIVYFFRFNLFFPIRVNCSAPFFSLLSYYRPFCRSSFLLFRVAPPPFACRCPSLVHFCSLVHCGQVGDVEYLGFISLVLIIIFGSKAWRSAGVCHSVFILRFPIIVLFGGGLFFVFWFCHFSSVVPRCVFPCMMCLLFFFFIV